MTVPWQRRATCDSAALHFVCESKGIAQHDREVVELQPLLGGVDVERAVGRGAAVLVLEYPVAADPIAHLEAIERHALVLERLRHRKPADAGADDASLGELRHLDRTPTTRGECCVTRRSWQALPVLRKNVSRETSGARPENTNLQNNPMH